MMFDRVRWIFFDVGDTLLDEGAAMHDWCAQVASELTRRAHHVAADRVWQAREQAYAEFSPDVLSRILEILAAENESSVYDVARYNHDLECPFPQAEDVLRRFAARFRLGVIANQALGTRDRLHRHGWAELISLCISSAERGLRKPDPAIFQAALDDAECTAAHAVMIGDRIDNDIRPAKALGMATIRIRQGLACVQQPRDSADCADVTVENLAALVQLLR